VVLAIALFSPISAAMAVLGSATGGALAMLFRVPSSAILAGLWGYNASLGAIAVGGMFFVLSWSTVLLAVLCSALCTLFQGCLAALFQPFGMPVMTLPFCFGVMTVVMTRVYVLSVQVCVRMSACACVCVVCVCCVACVRGEIGVCFPPCHLTLGMLDSCFALLLFFSQPPTREPGHDDNT